MNCTDKEDSEYIEEKWPEGLWKINPQVNIDFFSAFLRDFSLWLDPTER